MPKLRPRKSSALRVAEFVVSRVFVGLFLGIRKPLDPPSNLSCTLLPKDLLQDLLNDVGVDVEEK
jgi:hypothetical protein